MIRILIVDDSVAIREGLYSLLDRQPDFEVVGAAGDGLEGLSKALELLPDVVIMDAQMPKMDGVEATKRIKDASPSVGERQELFSEVRRIAAEFRQQGH